MDQFAKRQRCQGITPLFYRPETCSKADYLFISFLSPRREIVVEPTPLQATRIWDSRMADMWSWFS
jgi:hypothetical protein